MKSSTSASRSQPSGNTKNNRISRTTSSNMKNKVKDHPRSVKSKSNKMNHVIEPVCNAHVKHTMLNANSELICVKCYQCIFDANHDVCFLEFVNDVNVCSKSKSAKKSKNRSIWKPTGKVFTNIGYRRKPIGRTFTIAGKTCPLTRITSTKVVPLKETTSKSVTTQNPQNKADNRRPNITKSIGSSSKSKIKESRISINSKPNQSWGSNASNVPSSSLVDFRFSNDQITNIMGYGDYLMGNVTISQVYYVEGLGHNLFSVGQFCDFDLEVNDMEVITAAISGTGANATYMEIAIGYQVALMAWSYLPSKVSKILTLWRKDLKKVNFVILTICTLGAFVIVSRVYEIKDGCLESYANKETELNELTRSHKEFEPQPFAKSVGNIFIGPSSLEEIRVFGSDGEKYAKYVENSIQFGTYGQVVGFIFEAIQVEQVVCNTSATMSVQGIFHNLKKLDFAKKQITIIITALHHLTMLGQSSVKV
ncbi:integrase, catalytic region, zinc finger, CCHC-type containing protein [Tanacetum coccineum]